MGRRHFFRSGAAVPWAEVLGHEPSETYDISLIDSILAYDSLHNFNVEKIVDPTDWGGVLHDYDQTTGSDSWIDLQPSGEHHVVVKTKYGDGRSGSCFLTMELGAGVDGRDAIGLNVGSTGDGLPGIWFSPYRATGSGKATPSNFNFAHVVDFSENGAGGVELLGLEMKCPSGFRIGSAASPPANGDENWVLGTYNATAADIALADEESNNWHWYHRSKSRYDLNDNGWMTLWFNGRPDNQRHSTGGFSGGDIAYEPVRRTPNGATIMTGTYFDNVTRIYFDSQPYFGSPQIAQPYTILIGRLLCRRNVRSTSDPLISEFFQLIPTDYTDGDNEGDLVAGTPRFFNVDIKNLTTSTISGTVYGAGASKTGLQFKDEDEINYHARDDATAYSWAPGETKNFILRANNYTSEDAGTWPIGLTVLPTDRIEIASTYWNRSYADPFVERRTPDRYAGRHDELEMSSTMINLNLRIP